ncbi:hypothetical protein [Variovorax paradoxus]|uniref:hypothetical protein n=1 Tax=Variovorax paradoxus TaxID=34073 RepID=UPI00278A7779|nr:hypothetical protein [Variovorax paradoxus]MDP9932533.1 hypothetical protein [Variovorax paradoxus]
MSGPTHWTFSDTVAPERADRLMIWKCFQEVIDEVVATSALESGMWWEPARDFAGHSRASFVLRVPRHAYDAFFNARVGYRGQYAMSEAQGEKANRELVDALCPKLLPAVDGRADVTFSQVTASLKGAQAKVWIMESEVDDQLTAPHSSIRFAEWEFNEPSGQGLRAPVGTALEVKGAWVHNASGKEFFNRQKRMRSHNIFRTGDSK